LEAGGEELLKAGLSSAMTRRLRRAPLLVLASLLLAASVSFRGSAVDSFAPPTKAQAGAAALEVVSREHEECSVRLGNFVSELDALLDVNPNSLEPLLSLLQRTFPLKNCDIESAITISRKSKYFASASEQPTSYVIAFTSATPTSPPFSGFDVSFGVSKASGDSQYPFAQIHK
jgi:hypothetical protein